MVKTSSVDQVPLEYCCVHQQIRSDIWAKQLTQLPSETVLSNCAILRALYALGYREIYLNVSPHIAIIIENIIALERTFNVFVLIVFWRFYMQEFNSEV